MTNKRAVEVLYIATCWNGCGRAGIDDLEEAIKMARAALYATEWISVNDRLPEVEKRVLVSVTHHNEYNGKDYKLTTCAIYEDGTVNPEDSIWIMQDTDNEFMPAGWWEYHEYGNLEDDGVARIDGTVTHWMPLPEPPKEDA